MPVILNLSKNDKNILTNEKRCAIIVAKKEKNVYMRFRSEVLMLKISRKASVYISITLTVIFFLALIACAVIMPKISGLFVDAVNGFSKGETIGENGKIFVMTVGYLIVLSVGVADIMMCFFVVSRSSRTCFYKNKRFPYPRSFVACHCLRHSVRAFGTRLFYCLCCRRCNFVSRSLHPSCKKCCGRGNRNQKRKRFDGVKI